MPESLTKPRISSIDIIRGIVMVIMALDHVRDYFHVNALVFNPLALDKTHPALFFTRWITHFCAPTFVFLTGTSIAIRSQRKSTKELSLYLLTRGLWLFFLEMVVMRFGYSFNFYYDVTSFSIISVIGLSMVFMSAVIYLPGRWALVMGVVLTFGHNALDGIQLEPTHFLFAPWMLLMRFGFLNISPGHSLLISYPILPWLGIMVLGYSLGVVYSEPFDSSRRQRLLWLLGLAVILLFIVLRLLNVYGDAAPWGVQKNALFTIMSFVNCSKYPVSLLFTLMTLGPMLLLLALLEKIKNNVLQPFRVFGRVPLFYFIIHFYVIHAAALVLLTIHTGKSFSDIDFHFAKSFGGITPGEGYSLPWIYVAWIILVGLMYPLCRWYDRYKSSHRQVWLSYL